MKPHILNQVQPTPEHELLARHALMRMGQAEEKSTEWLYWRGVSLGLEAGRKPGMVKTEWLDAVYTVNKGKT
jgi:hypothetical protein